MRRRVNRRLRVVFWRVIDGERFMPENRAIWPNGDSLRLWPRIDGGEALTVSDSTWDYDNFSLQRVLECL